MVMADEPATISRTVILTVRPPPSIRPPGLLFGEPWATIVPFHPKRCASVVGMAEPAPPVIPNVLDHAWDVAQRLAIEAIEYPANNRDQVMQCVSSLLVEAARQAGCPYEAAREFAAAMEQHRGCCGWRSYRNAYKAPRSAWSDPLRHHDPDCGTPLTGCHCGARTAHLRAPTVHSAILRRVPRSHEALAAEHHFGMLPAGERQSEVIQPVGEPNAGYRDTEQVGISEVRQALLPRRMLLTEDHVAFRAVQPQYAAWLEALAREPAR
jgi:hypothetical protein